MPLAASPHLTPEHLMQFMWGFTPPLMLEAALKNRVFDVLDEGPKTLDELSTATNASVRGLGEICNALVSFEFLTKDHKERYVLTSESSAFLVRNKSGSQGGALRHIGEHLLPKWLQLNEAVRIGQKATFPTSAGESTTCYEQFVEDLFPKSYQAAQVLAKSLHLEAAEQRVRVLDLATGSGVWSVALAEAAPSVQATVVDWPDVITITRRVTARRGLRERFAFVEGDILEVPFGSGYDLATLGHILHGGGRTRARILVRKTFQALNSGGTIVLSEMTGETDQTRPRHVATFVGNMLLDAQDKYSLTEVSQWLKEAGFSEPHILNAPGSSPLIVATKPF